VRQAMPGVEDRGGGLGVGADLTGGGPEGIGGLQRVATRNALPAAAAAAEMHAEAAVNRGAWDLGLELVADVGFDERAPAMRASVRKLRLVALVDLVGGRRRPMAVGAMLVAGFAAGRLRLGFGRPFAERRGLPLASTKGGFELTGEVSDLGLKRGDSLGEFAATRAPGVVHPAMLPAQTRFSCACWPKGTLNKYRFAGDK
jgi:hypothetical protein